MRRPILLSALLLAALTAAASAQTPPPSPLGAAIEKETKGLSSEEFPERQAALKRLESLLAEQLRQRAAIQDVLDSLRKDLASQNHALAMVADEEAQAQIAGLLDTERALAAWTIHVMTEPLDRRQKLLAWGLGKDGAPLVANAFAKDRRTRVKGISALAQSPDPAAAWTLSRLVNEGDPAIRAAAMAASWDLGPKASQDLVSALWHRAITGPALLAQREELELNGPDIAGHSPGSVHVDFPGGDPLEFESTDDDQAFTDALLAADVLIHLNNPLVEAQVKRLVADQSKKGKTLSLPADPDWTLATHRLVEAYKIKDAIPLLAEEALARDTSGDMSGDVNGRPYIWSPRTMAIGTLATLTDQDPQSFHLFRVKEQSELRGWTWGTDQPAPNANGNANNGNPEDTQGDLPVVKAFYAWWNDNYKTYGIKTAPSSAAIPKDRPPRLRIPRINLHPVTPEPATQPANPPAEE